jgi:hypothetical protein
MTLPTTIRKIYQGVADRRQLFRMFDRHAQRPNRWQDDAGSLYAGEWFEIAQPEHDYMLDILPPLWMRGDMFAMREFLTGSITSIFFTLTIDGRLRWFHGYCDLSDTASPDRMKSVIIERESRPIRAMTREERLDYIWSATHDDIFTEEFLLTRPLLSAIRRDEPTVLLVDEVDKTDIEVEGLLLEVLSDFQVTIPELGTVTATRRPFVVLTSNASRELSEAVKRRCLFLHLDYPDAERERAIVTSQVPRLDDKVVAQLVDVVVRLRELELKKAPSIAESVDWARTLIALQIDDLDEATVARTLGVVLKHASDQRRAVKELKLAVR